MSGKRQTAKAKAAANPPKPYEPTAREKTAIDAFLSRRRKQNLRFSPLLPPHVSSAQEGVDIPKSYFDLPADVAWCGNLHAHRRVRVFVQVHLSRTAQMPYGPLDSLIKPNNEPTGHKIDSNAPIAAMLEQATASKCEDKGSDPQ